MIPKCVLTREQLWFEVCQTFERVCDLWLLAVLAPFVWLFESAKLVCLFVEWLAFWAKT